MIFVTIVGFGFLEGVGIGMLVTTAFFAVRLSRVEPVEAEFTAREHSSNKIAPSPIEPSCAKRGRWCWAFRLRGYIFFGSVYRWSNASSNRCARTPPPACVLLDFSAVAGIDFSAMNALCMFVKAAHADGARVVLSAASEQCRTG